MDDQAPPPYSLIASIAQDGDLSSDFNPRSLTSHLHSHIAALPGRMRQTQQSYNARQVETDIWILDHLAPIVESFLADLGAQRTAPPLATLTLVPNSAVPADAVLSGIDDMLRRNEVGRVFRVDVRRDAKADGDSKGSKPSSTTKDHSEYREFTDWGRWEEPGSSSTAPSDLLWWKDEALAHRLASYLQPQTKPKPPMNTTQSSVQVAVEQSIPAEKPKKGWGFGWRKNDPTSSNTSPSTTVSLPVTPDNRNSRPGTVEAGDLAGIVADQLDNGKRAEMHVSAEELAFRRENDFGIWESTSGWAIVVTLKVYT